MHHNVSEILLDEYIKLKRLHVDAQIPTKNHYNDAGFDLYSVEDIIIPSQERKVIKTGIALEIPSGYAGLIWPRSGLSVKQGVDVLAGVIDASYRGEIMVCLYNTQKPDESSEWDGAVEIHKGDRIAQLILQKVPLLHIKEVEALSDTERQDKGFGSSGK